MQSAGHGWGGPFVSFCVGFGAMADGSGSGADLHPLQSPWTLWYYQAPANGSHSGGSGEWEQNLTAVGSFETVEGFWGCARRMRALGATAERYSLV